MPIGNVRALGASFKRTLLAENKAPSTIAGYTSAVERFAGFLEASGMPTAANDLTREHVEHFIAHLLEHSKPATASNRYRALQAFFAWCCEEGEIAESPMRNMRPPAVPEVPGPVLGEDRVAALAQDVRKGPVLR